MVDSLGIRDPQALLLRKIRSASHWAAQAQENVYPKWAIPASHGSIVLQDVLLVDAGVLVLPIPLVSFKIAISKMNKGTRMPPTDYRRTRRGLAVLGCL